MSWENAIGYYLGDYAPEYHEELLRSITEDKQPRVRAFLTFEQMVPKLSTTSFVLHEGELVRVSS